MNNNASNGIRFAFFGTSSFASIILTELEKAGLTPVLVVTQPDRPQGRDQTLTAPAVKTWAEARSIPVLQPESARDKAFLDDLRARGPWDVFVVAAYGEILPPTLIDMPKRKTLNVHPSLLPHWRGPSPVQYQILNDDRELAVTVMRIDEKMDHGPIVAQEKVTAPEWPMKYTELHDFLAVKGGELLARALPSWVDLKLFETEQDHTQATYCKLVTKADGEIDLSADGRKNWLKFNAFYGWPGVFAMVKKGDSTTRVVIKEAKFENGKFIPVSVVPAGKREMGWEQFTESGQ